MKMPKQIYVPYVGAVYSLLGKLFFVINGLTFLMSTRNAFYNSSDSLLKDTFGTYAVLMLVISISCGFGMLLVYIFGEPSINKFSQDQAVKDGRSLTYEKLLEIEKQIGELRK